MRPVPVLLGAAMIVCAQESRFDVRSRLVLVPVNVADAKGRSVDDLAAPDFLVFDNGRPQKAIVDTIGSGVAPIALVIAVQSSGISIPVLEKVQKIGSMIQPLVTGDRGCAAVLSFAERLTWLQRDCSNGPYTVQRAFDELRPGEHKEARMLDAVHAAVEKLRSQQNARRVLLLISESRDRGSETTLDAAAVAAQSAGVSVYAATYSIFKTAFTSKAKISQPERPEVLRRPNETIGTVNGNPDGPWNAPHLPPPEQRVDLLAGIGELARLGKINTTEVLTEGTGGATFPFTKLKTLEAAIQKLGAELHSQYLVSFAPENPEPGYHRLEVRISRSGEFRIRARPGYWPQAAAE
jgi:VWFA-related protein